MSVATENIYTLADLKNWPPEKADMPTGGTALAVIGHPIAHSLSPVMHNAALTELAKADPKFAKWRYFKFDIAPDNLKEALHLFYRNKFRGLNLTVPHKILAMQCIKVRPEQELLREMGAANTLEYTDKGWSGHNTDGRGLSEALLKEPLKENLKGANVILLGAGGAARAAATKILSAELKSLWIGNRTAANRNALLTRLKKSRSFVNDSDGRPCTHLEGFDPKNPPTTLPVGAIVINATSLGLKPDDESPLDLTQIPRPAKVFDMIYRPAQTKLLLQATSMKIPNANGLSMLVYQGVSSLEIWVQPFFASGDIINIMESAVQQALAAH
jgi:shikimate dehydrogenase